MGSYLTPLPRPPVHQRSPLRTLTAIGDDSAVFRAPALDLRPWPDGVSRHYDLRRLWTDL